MAWTKSPEELIAAFAAALPDDSRVERRKMFGYPCAFTNGNMFAGLHQNDLIVRLSDAKRALFLREKQARQFEPMPGRIMREYVALPPSIIGNARALKAALADAFEYVVALPPKKPKKPKTSTAPRNGKGKR